MIVKEGRTEMTVSHNGKNVNFIYPPVGPGSLSDTAQYITNLGLARPTLSEIVSLIHACYKDEKNEYSNKILGWLENSFIWSFTALSHSQLEICDNPRIVRPRSEGEHSYDNNGPNEIFWGIEEGNYQRPYFVPTKKLSKKFPFHPGREGGIIRVEDIVSHDLVVDLVGREGADKLFELTKIRKSKKLWLCCDAQGSGEIPYHAPFIFTSGSNNSICLKATYSNDLRGFAFGLDRGNKDGR